MDPAAAGAATGPALALQVKADTLLRGASMPSRGWSLLTLGSIVGSAAGAV